MLQPFASMLFVLAWVSLAACESEWCGFSICFFVRLFLCIAPCRAGTLVLVRTTTSRRLGDGRVRPDPPVLPKQRCHIGFPKLRWHAGFPKLRWQTLPQTSMAKVRFPKLRWQRLPKTKMANKRFHHASPNKRAQHVSPN